jgi:hypothetical protein
MISEATREKQRLAAFKRDNSKRIAALPKGKRHWNWSENPNLLTLHKRLHRKHGSAKNYKCSFQGCEKQAHDWANKTGKYSDDVNDYEPLCRSHHVKKDKNWIKRK